MQLAILVTNTDLSTFAHRHPLDGEKFTTMIKAVRPDWSCTAFEVHQDEFPSDLADFDGIIITGSPASVHDGAPWGARLLELIRQTDLPIFGACYGHQAVALALGGQVGPNPGGWIFGLERCDITRPPMPPSRVAALAGGFHQFAAHKEQVTELPTGAQTIATSNGVPHAGFVIGNRIYTTQNHPEMSADFFGALVDEFEDGLGPDVAGKARASLSGQADNAAYAETVAAFFEQATAAG